MPRLRTGIVGLLALALGGCSAPVDAAGESSSRRVPTRAPEDSPDALPALKLEVEAGPFVVTAGGRAHLDVHVSGGTESSDRVVLSLRGVAVGLRSDPVFAPMNMGHATATLEVRADTDARQGLHALQLDARREGEGTASTTTLSMVVRGTPGELDTTFAQGGSLVATQGGSAAAAMALGQDDSIVALHRCGAMLCVLHLDAEGAVDVAYGDGGGAELPLAFPEVRQVFALRDAKGQVVVAVEDSDALGAIVAKLGADGHPVPTFGDGALGQGTRRLSAKGTLAGLVATDGGSMVLGFSEREGDDAWFGLHRLDATGRSAPGFGTGGHARVALHTPESAGSQALGGYAWGLEALGAEHVLIVGDGALGSTRYFGAAAVSQASGVRNASFGANGEHTYPFGVPSARPLRGLGRQVAIGTQGIRAMVGWEDSHGAAAFAVVALTDDGRPVAGFGAGGRSAPFVIDDLHGSPLAIAVDEAGRTLVLVGATTGTDAEILRVGVDGELDATFGAHGRARLHGGRGRIHGDLRLQKDGRIVVLTTQGDRPEDQRWVLSRYWP